MHRFEDNIRTSLEKTMCEGVDQIRLAYGRAQLCAYVGTKMNLRV
jgi:hypothetical protein